MPLRNPRSSLISRSGIKFDPSIIFYNLHFLTGAKMQGLPHCFGYNDLIFWRYGYSLHAKTSIDPISYYNNVLDKVCQFY